MTDDKNIKKDDPVSDLMQEAELDRIMLEATSAPQEKVRAELAAAGYTRGKVDAIFKGHVRALRPPKLKYVGAGALGGFAIGVVVGALLAQRPPERPAPALDGGTSDAAPIRGDLIATTPVSAKPFQTAAPPTSEDAQDH